MIHYLDERMLQLNFRMAIWIKMKLSNDIVDSQKERIHKKFFIFPQLLLIKKVNLLR